MFHNDCFRSKTSNEKSKRRRSKKSNSFQTTSTSKQIKHSNNSKLQKNHKYSKHFKHINNVSDYLGPERLTKHVGFFSKGKISDSISRIEKIVSKEVKARAKQDLREVLKLTCSVKNKHNKNPTVNCESISTETLSVQSACKSPEYTHQKTRFGSHSWRDKLQKSVGMSAVNSVLASVHEPQEPFPVKESPVTARKVLLTTIHPFIKSSNNLLFPNLSNRNKIKQELKFLRNKLAPCTTFTPAKTSSCSHCENSQISSNIEEVSTTQNSLEDFQLNPIFTGDVIDQNDITQMFPTVNKVRNDINEFISEDNLDTLSNEVYNYKRISGRTSSVSSIGGKSAITLIPTSPATLDGSPVWKLQISSPKFVPELGATPTLYFRHKMF